jgi:hypothetical protein
LVCSVSAWCVSATKNSQLKLFKAMIGIYCQSQTKHGQRLGGHCIAYCKLLVLNLMVLPTRFEYLFLAARWNWNTELERVTNTGLLLKGH